MKYREQKEPFFSVVIPTKGRAQLLEDTIFSVLNQSFKDFEVLVVDNDDGDETKEVVSKFSDNRLLYLRTGSLPMKSNWQVGISHAKGRFVILTADKTGIKQDGLMMLYKYVNLYPDINVFNYEYDAYYDEENIYVPRLFESQPMVVDADKLISLFLESKQAEFGHLSGRGYNSCISRDVLKNIHNRVGDVCVGFNPDYTIAYNLILDGQSALYIPESPLLARSMSLQSNQNYGNGSSYNNKTDLFKSYLEDCIKDGSSYCDLVPIKAFVVYSVLLNDFLHVASKWNRQFEFKIIKYYLFHYKETLYRRSFGVDVKEELQAIGLAIGRENILLRIRLFIPFAYLFLRAQFYPIYRFIEKYPHVGRWFSKLRRQGEYVTNVNYSSYRDCVSSVHCVLP